MRHGLGLGYVRLALAITLTAAPAPYRSARRRRRPATAAPLSLPLLLALRGAWVEQAEGRRYPVGRLVNVHARRQQPLLLLPAQPLLNLGRLVSRWRVLCLLLAL